MDTGDNSDTKGTEAQKPQDETAQPVFTKETVLNVDAPGEAHEKDDQPGIVNTVTEKDDKA